MEFVTFLLSILINFWSLRTNQSNNTLHKVMHFVTSSSTFGAIAIINRQYQDGVDMIGRYHQRIDMKRQMLSTMANRIPQTIPYQIVLQNTHPLFRDHSKEIRSTRHIKATKNRQNSLRRTRIAYHFQSIRLIKPQKGKPSYPIWFILPKAPVLGDKRN
jgi:hypothetical protein